MGGLWNGHGGRQEPGLEVYVVIEHLRSDRRSAEKELYASRSGESPLTL
jgi:hypothetical protein